MTSRKLIELLLDLWICLSLKKKINLQTKKHFFSEKHFSNGETKDGYYLSPIFSLHSKKGLLFTFIQICDHFKECRGKDVNGIELKKHKFFHKKCMQFKEMFDILVLLVTNKWGQRQWSNVCHQNSCNVKNFLKFSYVLVFFNRLNTKATEIK